MKIEFIENKHKQVKPDIAPKFGAMNTDYMFMMDYNKKDGWHNAKLVPFDSLEFKPTMFTLHYALTIFEGLKAFKTSDNKIMLYRAKDNFKRLNESAKRLAMPCVDEDFVYEAMLFHLEHEKRWFYDDENTSIYIRPFMFADEEFLGMHDPESYKYMVIMSPTGPYFDKDVALKVEETYSRSVSGGMGEAKTGGNYAASMLATKKAYQEGFDQVIWLDGIEKRFIEEAGVMNIFVVIDNKAYTPKTNGTILKGITRDSSILYLKDLGYEVFEEDLDINKILELYKQGKVTEIFATGTAASIMPISKVRYKEEDMMFKYDKDSLSIKLSNYFKDVRSGKQKDKYNHVIVID